MSHSTPPTDPTSPDPTSPDPTPPDSTLPGAAPPAPPTRTGRHRLAPAAGSRAGRVTYLAAGTTLALVAAMGGLAAIHRAPAASRNTSTAQTVSTTPGEARLGCAPAPRLQATSADRQFDAGRGVSWSRVTGSAVAAATQRFGSVPLPVDTEARQPAPAPTRSTATQPSQPAQPSETVTEPADEATEVPRPSTAPPAATASPAAQFPNPDPARSLGQVRAADLTGLVPQSLLGEPEVGQAPLVAGTSVSVSGSGDLRGISAAACVAASESIWLVGGRSGAGTGGRVVISNPADTSATVNLKLLTRDGTTTPPVGTGLVVAPRTTREILVRSLAPQESVLTVGVSAVGAPVVAYLVDQRVAGTDPAGVEVVTDSQPARRQVLLGRSGTATSTILRLAVPGNREATVAYRIEDVDGTFGKPEAVTLPGGSSLDLDVTDSPESASRVVVEADQPVLAALEITRRAGSAADRAWAVSSAALSGPTVVVVPRAPGVAATLQVSSVLQAPAGDNRLTVQRYDATGRALSDLAVTVPTNGVLEVPAAAIGGATTLVLRPTRPVHAALNLTGSGTDRQATLISSLAIPPAAGSRIDTVVQHAGPGDWP